MKVIFVGSNPSHVGPDSPAIKNLRLWQEYLELSDCGFTNVSDVVTPGNRPLKKSEYELDNLFKKASQFDKVIALGNTADDALTKAKIDHFKLPHPSPRNRQLNSKEFIQSELDRCREYLNDYQHGRCNAPSVSARMDHHERR